MITEPSPFLSVITSSLNRAAMIGAAVESVLSQGYSDFEHIIIDGGSTDGTLEVLEHYPHLKVISEADRGVYDAWNKGLALAQGEVLTFLNSDDRWSQERIADILALMQADPSIDIITSGAAIYELTATGQVHFKHHLGALPADQIIISTLVRGTAFNSWFVRRRVFEKLGGFNLKYPLSADLDFCFRAALHPLNIRPVDREIYYYFFHPDSLTFSYAPQKVYRGIVDTMIMCEDLLDGRLAVGVNRKYLKKLHRMLALRATKREFLSGQWIKAIKTFWKMTQYL